MSFVNPQYFKGLWQRYWIIFFLKSGQINWNEWQKLLHSNNRDVAKSVGGKAGGLKHKKLLMDSQTKAILWIYSSLIIYLDIGAENWYCDEEICN